MKKIFLYLVLTTTTLTFLNFQCKKEQVVNCITGKLVVKGLCSQYVIQVIGSDTSELATDAVWNDPETGKTYNNVFTVSNYCDFPAMEVGETFTFRINQEKPILYCIICAAIRATPTAKNSIKYTGTGNCQ
jgi:hypothetical protein